MSNLAKVFFSQTKQRRAVKLGVATDEVVRVRMQFFAVTVAPRFFRVVLAVEVNGLRAPVVLLARHIVAALKQKNLLAGGRQFVGQRAAAGARADDDDVVVIIAGHDGLRLLELLHVHRLHRRVQRRCAEVHTETLAPDRDCAVLRQICVRRQVIILVADISFQRAEVYKACLRDFVVVFGVL